MPERAIRILQSQTVHAHRFLDDVVYFVGVGSERDGDLLSQPRFTNRIECDRKFAVAHGGGVFSPLQPGE